MNRLTLVVRIAVAIAFVVVPFGYAITGFHSDVLMGAGCGIAIGVGVGLRGGSRSGLWTGILIGSIVGMAVVLVAGGISGNRWGLITPPTLALAVGLIDGLDRSSLAGYREMSREALIVAVLLTLGFLPAHVAEGILLELQASDDFLLASILLVFPLLLMPLIALMAGLLTHRREGWRDARPPRLLILGAAVPPVLFAFLMATGTLQEGRGLSGMNLILGIAYALGLFMVALPAAAFLLGRAATAWLQPRLQVYSRLAEYLRAMWVPIGGFAVGYLTIIVLFARVLRHAGALQPRSVRRSGRRIRGHRLAVLRVLHRTRPGLSDRGPRFRRCQAARRSPPDLLGGMGGRVVRGGDVIHRPEAGPDRAAACGGRRGLTGLSVCDPRSTEYYLQFHSGTGTRSRVLAACSMKVLV